MGRLVENLDVFFVELGIVCSKGAVQFAGLLDQPDETLTLGGVNVLSTMYQLTVKTCDAQRVALKSNDTVLVAGASFIVRDVFLVDDGALTKVSLSK